MVSPDYLWLIQTAQSNEQPQGHLLSCQSSRFFPGLKFFVDAEFFGNSNCFKLWTCLVCGRDRWFANGHDVLNTRVITLVCQFWLAVFLVVQNYRIILFVLNFPRLVDQSLRASLLLLISDASSFWVRKGLGSVWLFVVFAWYFCLFKRLCIQI